MPETKPMQVLVAVDDGPGFGGRAHVGVRRYARENPDLLVRLVPQDQLQLALLAMAPSGLIVQVSSPRRLRLAQAFAGPVVNISGAMRTELPTCTIDNKALGAAAAAHLCDRGYRSLAYTITDWLAYSLDRGEGFRRIADDHGCACSAMRLRISPMHSRAQFALENHLAKLLAALPPRTGLFLSSWPLTSVSTVARLAGRRIPDDLAVVQVGDDPASCELEDVPLTTVDYPAEKIGYDAAQMLHAMLLGRPRPAPRLASPLGVTPRASTDHDAVDDPEVAAILRLIRARFRSRCRVEALLNEVNVSRSTLERRFVAALGRTPASELRRQRLAHAQRLLAETDLTLHEVARQAGLRRPQYLCAVMHDALGVTPMQYRRSFQMRPLSS